MARVEIAAQGWGWIADRHGEGIGGATVTIKNADGSNAATWSAITGGTSSTGAVTTASDGTIPRFIDAGSYDVIVQGVTRRVEAVSGSVESREVVRPESYGAVGDGVVDDTAAIQAAANAFIPAGKALLLNPATTYRVTSTIEIKPQTGTSFRGRIIGVGPTPITWDGGSGTDAARKFVFRVQGMKRSRVEGVTIQLPSSATYVHGWELDNVPGSPGTYTSLSQTTWANCHVLGSGSNTGCGSFRIGHADNQSTDFSFLDFENCGTAMGSGTPPAGTFHVLNEGSNSLNINVRGGYAYSCDTPLSTRPTTGAGGLGNGSLFVYGFGTSKCNVDFDFPAPGAYVVYGGRYELGKRLLTTDVGGGQGSASVTMTGLEVASYAPTDGILFALDGSSTVALVNSTVRPLATTGTGTTTSGSPTVSGVTGAFVNGQTITGTGIPAGTTISSGGGTGTLTLSQNATASATVTLSAQTDYSATAFTLTGSSISRGRLSVRGCNLGTAGTFHTIGGAAQWVLDFTGNAYRDAAGKVTTLLKNYLAIAGGESADVLMLGLGTAVAQQYMGFGPPSSSGAPRVRVGMTSSGDAVVDGVGNRQAILRANSVDVVTATTDGRARINGGLRRKRTSPGAYPYTALVSDHYIAVSGASAGRNVSLPTAASVADGHEYVFKNRTGANAVTVTPNGTDTIDGVSAASSVAASGVLRLISDGVSNWEVV